MFTKLKKLSFMLLMMLTIFITGAWQNTSIAFAAGQNENIPAAPLYPDLAWDNLGPSVRDITISINGDSVSLPGNSYRAVKEFSGDIPEDILNYYSNSQLAQTGWESYDSFENTNGVYRVFYHETGVYLSVEFLKCSDNPSLTCISLWESEQTNALSKPLPNPNEQQGLAAASFSKSSPSNNASSINPASATLAWDAYSPTPEKYSYCIKEGSECSDGDPNWTGTYLNRSITLTNLSYGKTYYWQVKAITCASCDPKIFVYANSDAWWTFTTAAPPTYTISGKAGIAGATLSYTDGTAKTATSGLDGSYSFTVSYKWSGTVTPSKAGYLFTPTSKSYTNVTGNQTSQNFTAKRTNIADFDGDGKTDAAKYLSSTGYLWYVKSSTGAWDGKDLSTDGTYVRGSDFDGDGKTDPAKFVAGTVWYIKSSTGTWDWRYVGTDGTYVSGSDFDGDGKTDPAKFVAGTVWYLKSSTGTWDGRYVGTDGDYVSGADFDGDGKTDPAKFVSSPGSVWYLKSGTGTWDGIYIGSDGTFISSW
jgi:hypothetical protein